MRRPAFLFVGVLLAVGGYGVTRWVETDLACGTGKQQERWERGPERISVGEVGQPVTDHGTPRRALLAMGWSVAAIGAAMAAAGCTRQRIESR